jgi:hypothetical protein
LTIQPITRRNRVGGGALKIFTGPRGPRQFLGGIFDLELFTCIWFGIFDRMYQD